MGWILYEIWLYWFATKKEPIYSVNFKLKVLKAIDKDSLSLRSTSIKFNMPDTAIIAKWRGDFANFGLNSLQPKTRGRTDNR